MALRYRKRIKIAPGIYINISKSGVSTTIGPRGASVNFGKNGTYVNAGIPGTGLYERQRIDKGGTSENLSPETKNLSELPESSKSLDYNSIITGVIIFLSILTIVLVISIDSQYWCFFLLCFYLISLFSLLKLKRTHNKESDASVVGKPKETTNNESQENETSFDKKRDNVTRIKEVAVDDILKEEIQPPKETSLTDEYLLEPYDPKLDLQDYRYPTLDLLYHDDDNTAGAIDLEEARNKKNYLKTVLSNFGVEILDNMKATFGPVVTLYEITLAPGLSASALKGLEEDLAIALSAKCVAINPLPWKGTIGIEVPNEKRQLVSMKSLMNNRKFQETDYELPLALGKTITNEPLFIDLVQMPHILIAGSTGQGKSVLLNIIITSLLYKKHPAELKLILVDPRRLEFNLYSPIANHFLAEKEDEELPIITEAKEFVQTLKSLCVELDNRYELLEKASVKNVKEYNIKLRERKLNPKRGHRYLPYIVTIIDSFNDLTYGYEVEIREPLTKLVKLGRTIGIHIVLATGRPSSDIVTSEIKTYFPARIAFRLPEKVDSKIILDTDGAESLLGGGDMMFKLGTTIIRAQSAYIDTDETTNIVRYIAKQQSYTSPYLLPEYFHTDDEEGVGDVDLTHLDPQFEDAAHMIVNEQSASTSTIQRKFSIGYNRAGRLMDQLEKAGIVGPAKGSKPREVLCSSEEQLRLILNNLK